MYLRKLIIKNIKCFEYLTLDLTSDGSIRRWTSLLGENGVGKSTLLQAMAVPLAGSGAARELVPVADGWVRVGASYGELSAELIWHEGDAQLPHWPKKTPYNARYIVTGSEPDKLPSTVTDPPTVPAIVEWAGDGPGKDRERLAKDISRLKKTAYAENKPGWLACGYGPFRRLSGGSQDADRILYSGRKAARFVTLFREDAALTSATEWLIGLYNTARDGDEQSQHALQTVKDVFGRDFLLENAEVVVDARSASLKFKGRSPTPFSHLSDGYRSILALGVDLLRWILQAFPESKEPLNAYGVVLIDELDAHLHPLWQQRIGRWLLEKFPNLQFIIATHSPFLAQVADQGGNVVLRRHQHRVVAEEDTAKVRTWRYESILQELFGLKSGRAPGIDKLLNQLARLATKENLTETERATKSQLELQLGALPPDFEHIQDRQVTLKLRDLLTETEAAK